MTAVFDIGKTNKKLFVFDDELHIVYEKTEHLSEVLDDDGFLCEDVATLTDWMRQSLVSLLANPDFTITRLNFSGYGASFVHLDRTGKPATPLYNYLKPFPENCLDQFYKQYGSRESIARQTASPALGHLNSGMQLFWLKHAKPKLFKNIAVSLHLPQFLSSVFSGYYFSDITGVGCHTQLWDFEKNRYHDWVMTEKLDNLLPPVVPSNSHLPISMDGHALTCGVGLHDSSAALIPYLKYFHQPFVLLSTGTWSIALNPFNQEVLTDDDLNNDCLCYLSYEGKPVKASRLFLGHEHDEKVKQLCAHYHQSESYFAQLDFNTTAFGRQGAYEASRQPESADQAYYLFMEHVVYRQVEALKLVINPAVQCIFVDGGFSKNQIFMNLLARYFPTVKVFGATVPQASALGATLAIAPELTPALHKHFILNQY